MEGTDAPRWDELLRWLEDSCGQERVDNSTSMCHSLQRESPPTLWCCSFTLVNSLTEILTDWLRESCCCQMASRRGLDQTSSSQNTEIKLFRTKAVFVAYFFSNQGKVCFFLLPAATAWWRSNSMEVNLVWLGAVFVMFSQRTFSCFPCKVMQTRFWL